MFVGVRAAVAVAAGAAVVGLAGCSSSSSDRPRELPPLSTTPVVSTTSPAAPDKQTALKQAEAVVREYFHLLNQLHEDMDPAAFTALETANCPCKKFVASLRQVKARGQYYFGHAVLRGVTPTRDSAGLVEVLVSYDSARGGVKTSAGDVVASSPGRRDVTELFYVKYDSGSWRISNIVLVREGARR